MRLSQWIIGFYAAGLIFGTAARGASLPAIITITPAEITADLRSSDPDNIKAAITAIRDAMGHGHIADALWKNWLPALMRGNRFQDAADLSFTAALARPATGTIGPLLSFHARALLGLHHAKEALAAARSYYNVCDFSATADAVQIAAECLAEAYPEDLEIVRRFKAEQSAAGDSTSSPGATTQPAMLAAVAIDDQPYSAALKHLQSTTRFRDRVAYGNLLLAAGHAQEAEALFRHLYQLADTQDNLAIATEGLARSLRAEDGTIARANAWLLALRQGSQAPDTQP